MSTALSSPPPFTVRYPWLKAAGLASLLHVAAGALLYQGISLVPPLPPMQEIAVTLLPTVAEAKPEPPKPPKVQPAPPQPKTEKTPEPVRTPPKPVASPVKQEVMTSNAKPTASAAAVESKPAPAVESKAAEKASETPPAPAPVSAPRFDAAYLSNPAPNYPPLSRRMEEEGKVLLRVHVTPEGTASEVNIARSSGFTRLDEAAQNAVRRWRFVPAKQGDKAIAAWVNVPIAFKLDQ
jgi:protein TonB